MTKLLKSITAFAFAVIVSGNVFAQNEQTGIWATDITDTSAIIHYHTDVWEGAKAVGLTLKFYIQNDDYYVQEEALDIDDKEYYCHITNLHPNRTYHVQFIPSYQGTAGMAEDNEGTFSTNFSFEVNGICYNRILNSNNLCEATFSPNKYENTVNIPKEVMHEGKTYTVNAVDRTCFNDCVNLTSVLLPESVQKIGDSAFVGCFGLDSIILTSETPAEMGEDVFKGLNLNNVILHVPCGTKQDYKKHPKWTFFTNIEEDCGDNGIDEAILDNAVIVYPNPAKDRLTISADGEVSIINSLGQVVKFCKSVNGISEINISDLERGVYYIKVKNAIKKLIVE